MKEKGFLKFVLEVLSVVIASITVIAVCDTRRVFVSDEANNHVGKKWHYLYQYAKQKKPVDILVIGNSHAYTGLLPEKFLTSLHARCFILAAPGVLMDDCSDMLEEALTLIRPKLVILETFPINGYVQKDLDSQSLNSQFQSFAERRNVKLKLRSMFRLFRLENIPFAWSATLRNHDIIFDNIQLLKYNLKHPSGPEYDPKEDYLGRYARFATGLTEKTLNRYKTEGAPVDGSIIKYGHDAERATNRMLKMCKDKGIPVMFFTIPMYHEHVTNAEQWHNNLKPLIGNRLWLDLQLPAFNELFGPECFEDTYEANQHLSIPGAAKTTQILADFIKYTISASLLKPE